MNGDLAGAVSADDLSIRNNTEIHRFEAVVPNGDVVGYLVYDPVPRQDTGGKGMFVVVRTVVDPEVEGSGVAALLTRTALDHAREQHLTVIPECSYARAFIDQHPEYQDLLP